MLNVYSHEQIVAFVDAKLKKIGTGAMNDPKLNRSVVQMISVLPPAFQVLFLETGHDTVVGDMDEVNRTYFEIDKSNNHDRVGGFFTPGQRTIDNFDLLNPSVFQYLGAGKFSVRTLRHEKSHDIDFMLGEYFTPEGGTAGYFTSLSAGWDAALKREIEHKWKKYGRVEKSPDEVLDLPKEKMAELVDAQKRPDSLYDNYRPLLNHLSSYNTKGQKTRESFAEMCVHYMSLYEKTGGSMSSIDRKLSKQYPELWPHFRDDVLPRIEEIAQDLVDERRNQIMVYAIAEQNVADFWGLSYSQERSFRDAALALANGTFAERMEDFERIEEFFINPIDNYAKALQELDDLYYEYDADSVEDVDDVRDRAIAAEILHKKGRAAIGNAFLRVEHERESFEEFVAAYDSRLKKISPEFSIRTYFEMTTPRDTPVTYFKAIFEKGGEDAVKKHIEALPKVESVAAFHRSHHEWEKLTGELGRKPTKTKEFAESVERSSVVHLRAMIESQQYNAVVVRTAAIDSDRRALSDYGSALILLKRNVHDLTEGGIQRAVGTEILERYDRIKIKRGLDGVKAETEKLKITPDDIKEYVDARTSYWDWSRAYEEHGKNVPIVRDGNKVYLATPSQKFPAELNAAIASEIVDAVSDGGKTELLRRQREIQSRTHAIKGHAQGFQYVPDPLQACNTAADRQESKNDKEIFRALRNIIYRGLDIT